MGNNNKVNNDLATIFCLTIPQKLRDKIVFSENDYFADYSSLLPKESKKFYCYCVLDEIEKIGTNILRVRRLIRDEKNEFYKRAQGDRIARNVLQAIVDEQNLWIRKLTELLIEIINFAQCKYEIYFEHYLLTNRHQAYHKRFKNYKDFYSCERLRDRQKSILLENRIKEIESDSNFDINKAWYLSNKKLYINRKDKEISGRKNFNSLLKETLLFCKPIQKMILGFSYENYSRLSRSFHPNIGGPSYPATMEIIEINIMHVSLLAGNIELEIKKLFKFRSKSGFLSILQKLLNNNPYPKQLFKSLIQPCIGKGDFVAIKNEIAEVKKISINKFGYKTFRVVFLERDKKHPCKEDEFLGSELHLIDKRKKLIEDTKKIIKDIDPDAKLHGNSFLKSYRKYAVMLWQMMKNNQK